MIAIISGGNITNHFLNFWDYFCLYSLAPLTTHSSTILPFFSYLMLLCKYQPHSGEEKLSCVLFKVKSFIYINSTRCCLCCFYFSLTLSESHFLLSYSTRIRFLSANLTLDLGNKLPSIKQLHWKSLILLYRSKISSHDIRAVLIAPAPSFLFWVFILQVQISLCYKELGNLTLTFRFIQTDKTRFSSKAPAEFWCCFHQCSTSFWSLHHGDKCRVARSEN